MVLFCFKMSTSSIEIRILCLHGYRQSVKLVENTSETLTKKCAKYNIKLEWIDAPYKITENEFGYEKDVDRKKWWSFKSLGDFISPNEYDTLKESMNYVAKIYNEGKYDGILGFSQGSVLIQALILEEWIKPSFAILIATFSLMDPRMIKDKDISKDVRYLFCNGTNDYYVPTTWSKVIMNWIIDKGNKNCEHYEFEGDHDIPTDIKGIRKIISFIKNRN
jgi:hypothetical protein